MLRLLHTYALAAEHLPQAADAVPAHRLPVVVQLARQYAKLWTDFAHELDGRARIIDPSEAGRCMGASARARRGHPASPSRNSCHVLLPCG